MDAADEIEKLRTERDALKFSLITFAAQLAAAVPEGFVVVPRVATEAMLDAASDVWRPSDSTYRQIS